MPASRRRTRLLPLLVLAVVLALAVVLLVALVALGGSAPGPAAVSEISPRVAHAEAPRSRSHRPEGPGASRPSGATPHRRPGFDPEARRRREAVREQLHRALERRRTDPGAPSGSREDPDDEAVAEATLDAEYIRDRVQRDLVPLARECYEGALERSADLEGRVLMQFAIVGDESVGGIVEDMAFGEGTDIEDPDFRECVAESMKSVVFEPPARDGGRVEVSYPMRFQPG